MSTTSCGASGWASWWRNTATTHTAPASINSRLYCATRSFRPGAALPQSATTDWTRLVVDSLPSTSSSPRIVGDPVATAPEITVIVPAYNASGTVGAAV